jgi:hypothetical protein
MILDVLAVLGLLLLTPLYSCSSLISQRSSCWRYSTLYIFLCSKCFHKTSRPIHFSCKVSAYRPSHARTCSRRPTTEFCRQTWDIYTRLQTNQLFLLFMLVLKLSNFTNFSHFTTLCGLIWSPRTWLMASSYLCIEKPNFSSGLGWTILTKNNFSIAFALHVKAMASLSEWW